MPRVIFAIGWLVFVALGVLFIWYQGKKAVDNHLEWCKFRRKLNREMTDEEYDSFMRGGPAPTMDGTDEVLHA